LIVPGIDANEAAVNALRTRLAAANQRPRGCLSVDCGNLAGERHLRIRALDAPGQVAATASYTSGRAAHEGVGLLDPFSQSPCPGTPATLSTGPDVSSSGSCAILMPVHHVSRLDGPHGRVALDPVRFLRQMSTISDELVAHLGGAGANLRLTLELEAESPDGFPDDLQQTITENAATLKFESHEFEG
jgi:hypothetical protein